MTHRMLLGLALASAASLSAPRAAFACGGCFGPPPTPASAQVVTDHRMVLALSTTQTTLWDQIRYSGNPQEFSWILPIRYNREVQVATADNQFMVGLDRNTAPVLVTPQRNFQQCQYNSYGATATDASSSDAGGGVTVYREQVAGPYDVAIIGGDDPMAIRNWFTAHGYIVPTSVSPVIDYYARLHMDYLALRLRPGVGVSQMSPVRLTLPGYQPMLPLRMISAGISDKVALLLMVIADSRVAAENFPNGEVASSQLTYDFNRPTYPPTDFINAETALNASLGGDAWITESAQTVDANSLHNWVRVYNPYGYPYGYDAGPAPVSCDAGSAVDGGAMSDPDASASDASVGSGDAAVCIPPTDPQMDVDVALTGLGSRVFVTRLRAELTGDRLDRDLVLSAGGTDDRPTYYQYGTVLNNTPLPCGYGGTPVNGSGDGTGHGSCQARCAAGPVNSRSSVLGITGLVAAMAFVSRRRRNR